MFIAAGLFSCSPSDQERARRQSREVEEQVRTDARKAGHEVDKGLRETRDKVNQELDKHK